MKLFNKTSLFAIAAAATVAFGLAVSPAHAQETATATATVDVSNAFTLTNTTDLDFGTIAAVRRGGGGGAIATHTLGADSANDVTIANVGGATDDFLVDITSGDRATYTVAGAIPSQALVIQLPTTDLTLTCGVCTGGNPTFVVNTFVDDGGDLAVTTDGSGDATIFVGAVLNTVAGTALYEDGTYSNTYDIIVSY